MAGENRAEYIQEAFNFQAPPVPVPPPDVVAWIEPRKGVEGASVVYLSGANSMVREGGNDVGEIHRHSVLHIGVKNSSPIIMINGEELDIEKELRAGEKITYQYEPVVLDAGGYEISIENGPHWNISTLPDLPPNVTITKAYAGWDGKISIGCIAEDDYGVAGGNIQFSLPDANPDVTDIPPEAIIPSISVPGAEFCQ
tara:strand:- start:784 stop:1377 length:594 start_codon:yes stop_codon:yes gene_type:complete